MWIESDWNNADEEMPEKDSGEIYFVYVMMSNGKGYMALADYAWGEFELLRGELSWGDRVTHWKEVKFPAAPGEAE